MADHQNLRRRGMRKKGFLATDVGGNPKVIPFTTDADVVLGGGGVGPVPLAALPAHASTHENGGSDEVDVTGLSGLLADAQTPLAHKTSHQSGGSDAIKLDDLAAPDDNTDLNASTLKHGLLPKLSGNATDFLDGQGNWTEVNVAGSEWSVLTNGDPASPELIFADGDVIMLEIPR